MSAEEMLKEVQDIKEQCVMGLVSGEGQEAAEGRANRFLAANWMQVLDILDDSLYAYVKGSR